MQRDGRARGRRRATQIQAGSATARSPGLPRRHQTGCSPAPGRSRRSPIARRGARSVSESASHRCADLVPGSDELGNYTEAYASFSSSRLRKSRSITPPPPASTSPMCAIRTSGSRRHDRDGCFPKGRGGSISSSTPLSAARRASTSADVRVAQPKRVRVAPLGLVSQIAKSRAQRASSRLFGERSRADKTLDA